MEFKILQNVSIKSLFQAFTNAFPDDEVNPEISVQQFSEMISTYNFSPEDSMGCFIDDELAGFILSGVRNYNDEKHAYNIATGVIQKYFKKEIANEMFYQLIKLLKERGVSYFKLEVPENNPVAINEYKNLGFEVVRKLESFDTDKQSLFFPGKGHFQFNGALSELTKQNIKEFELSRPTWQNDLVSVGNNIDQLGFVSIEKNGQMIGYGFINRQSGQIPQLGVLPKWRNQGLEALLIKKLATKTSSDIVSFINVEAESYMSETLDNIGISSCRSQFEMGLKLKL
jgi:ribosomal protein S18 acetylase RimI-like enzyme